MGSFKKIKRGYPFDPNFWTSSFSNLTLGKWSKWDFRKWGLKFDQKFRVFSPRMTKKMSQKKSISEIFDEKIFMIKNFHFLKVPPNTYFKNLWKNSRKVSVKKYIYFLKWSKTSFGKFLNFLDLTKFLTKKSSWSKICVFKVSPNTCFKKWWKNWKLAIFDRGYPMIFAKNDWKLAIFDRVKTPKLSALPRRCIYHLPLQFLILTQYGWDPYFKGEIGKWISSVPLWKPWKHKK